MKKGFITLALLSVVALTSCGGNGGYKFKIMTPTGAPAAAFYPFVENENYEYVTNSVPKNVGAQLQSTQYDALVFDFYNGLKSIKNNQSDYRLARIITGGNFYLVGIDHQEEPTSENPGYIVSFGEDSLPTIVYRNVYGEEISNATNFVTDAKETLAVLNTGLHESNKVDYVLTAQPVLFNALNNSPIKDKLTVVASLRDKWEDKTGQKAIPQAGLFINSVKYEEHEAEYEAFLAELEDGINTCIEDPATMKAGIEKVGDEEAQANFFGFKSQVAFKVQQNNGFAFVSSEDSETIDISLFLESLGKGNEDYSDYIL